MTAARATARRLPALGVALAGVLLLAACTGAPDPAPGTPTASAARPSTPATAAPSPTVSSPTSAAPPASTPGSTPAPAPSGSAGSAAERYLGFVQQFSPTLAALQPDVVVALGERVCTDFGRGRDAAQVAAALGADSRATGLQSTDAAVVIGAAVATLCPQHRDRLAQ